MYDADVQKVHRWPENKQIKWENVKIPFLFLKAFQTDVAIERFVDGCRALTL